MINAYYWSLFFAVGVMLVEYWSKRVDLRHTRYLQKLISFSAGVSITYTLLGLLPLFAEAAFKINHFLFLSVLVGFTLHHAIEKEIYSHNKKQELIKTISMEENIFYYGYHLILGIILVTITNQDMTAGMLLFISMITYTLVGNATAEPHKSWIKALLLSTSTMLGALIATFLWTERVSWLEFSFVGLATGVLLFTVTRHHIPFGRNGDVRFFILGAIIYAALIILKWFV